MPKESRTGPAKLAMVTLQGITRFLVQPRSWLWMRKNYPAIKFPGMCAVAAKGSSDIMTLAAGEAFFGKKPSFLNQLTAYKGWDVPPKAASS